MGLAGVGRFLDDFLNGGGMQRQRQNRDYTNQTMEMRHDDRERMQREELRRQQFDLSNPRTSPAPVRGPAG